MSNKIRMKEEVLKETIVLYIDVSSFRAVNFNIEHDSIKTIIRGVSEKEIIVLSNSIFEGEFLSNADEVLREERERILRFGTITSRANEEFVKLRTAYQKISTQDILSVFSESLNFQSIDKDVSWKIVFEKYFQRKPPFSKKKKDEFPDAFVLEMLEEYKPGNLHIISNDLDFDEWVQSNPGVKIFKHLSDFTNKYLEAKNEQVANAANQVIEQVYPEIIKDLSDAYSDGGHYELDSMRSEVEQAEIRDLKVIDKKLLRIDPVEREAIYELDLRGEAKLDITSSVVVWDSIDREEMKLGSNFNTAIVDMRLSLKLKLILDESGELEFYEIEDEQMFAERFDIPHEWESFLQESGEEE